MLQFDPGLVQVMRNVLEEVMTRVPSEHSTIEVKAYLAEYILKAAARGQTSYDGLVAMTSGAVANCVEDRGAGSGDCEVTGSSCPVSRMVRHR
jgi:hypothetical protein